MYNLAIIFIIYAACAVVNYGWTLAFFQRTVTPQRARDNRQHDIKFAWLMAFAGPIGLLVLTLAGTWRKGWTLK